MLAMAGTISNLGLDFLKLHHLHIVRHTALGRKYQKIPFPLLGYEEYLELVVDFLERLNPVVRIERLFGDQDKGIPVEDAAKQMTDQFKAAYPDWAANPDWPNLTSVPNFVRRIYAEAFA